jgi:hypothetical protein
MNRIILTTSLLALAACGQTDAPSPPAPETSAQAPLETAATSAPSTRNAVAPAAPAITPNGYDATWNLTEGLPGEWPLGLAILRDGVTLQARAALDPAAPANIACPLPRLMNIHSWNMTRSETENWRFASAEKLTRIEATADITLEDEFDNGAPLTVKSGDIGTFKTYHSEGIFTSTWNGRDFTTYLDAFTDKAQFEEGPAPELWVNVRCYDGADTRAWINIEDALATDGVGFALLFDFGNAADIDPANLESLIQQNQTPNTLADIAPYPEDRYTITPFWSGEYPSAFAIVRDDVTLFGRSEMNPFTDTDVTCKMPHKATYSPWNTARTEADDLTFQTAVPTRNITLNEDLTIEALDRDTGDAAQLTLTTGDTLSYINYLSEGWFVASYDGVEYEMNESDISGDKATWSDAATPDEWVDVKCENDTRAWLRYGDVITKFGVRRYNYTGYGEAADLP